MDYYYDEASAEHPIKWIEKYCHASDGSPFRLLEYQKQDIIRPMFGWKRADGTYKHTFCYIEIPKGNGKSGLLSALATYLCFASGEKNAEIYAIAYDRKQAGLVHEDIKKIVRSHPELERRANVLRDTVTFAASGNKVVAVSSEVGGSHGWRPLALIFDELHTYRDSELFDSYVAGLIKRRNSMAFILTTAGKVGTFAEDIHNHALAIKEGRVVDDHWHVAIYAADPAAPPFEPETFISANPAYGTLLTPHNFEVILSRARNSPSNLASYKQLHLNVWTGRVEDWLTAAEWDACSTLVPEEEYAGLPCYGGLDLAATRDLTAFSIMWPLPDGRVVWRCWFWIPEATVEERVKQENHQYRAWVDAGLIRVTQGNVQDHDIISEEIAQLCEKYGVVDLRFDSWGMVGAVKKLSEIGLPMAGFRYGFYSCTAPLRDIERLVVSGKMCHGGNPVLTWMIMSAKVVRDQADNLKLDKGDRRSKIDGPVSGIMAMAGLIEGRKAEAQIPDDWKPTFF